MASAALALALASCSLTSPAPAPLADKCAHPPEYHQVRRGDSLFRIGWQYCLNYHDIAAWNKVRNPDLILVGQRLRLYPPATLAKAPRAGPTRASRQPTPTPRPALALQRRTPPSSAAVASATSANGWQWPSQGSIVSRFNPEQPGRNGIRIRGRPGQTVSAASDGRIVYTGNSLPGYGTLIIVEHGNGLLSAYGYLGKLYVKEGDRVARGEAIAELGTGSGSGHHPALHFEIRKNGQPVDPLKYLPT